VNEDSCVFCKNDCLALIEAHETEDGKSMWKVEWCASCGGVRHTTYDEHGQRVEFKSPTYSDEPRGRESRYAKLKSGTDKAAVGGENPPRDLIHLLPHDHELHRWEDEGGRHGVNGIES
jgi:hypothetical protein